MLEKLNIVLECLQMQQYYSGMLRLICTFIREKKSKLSYQCVNASVVCYDIHVQSIFIRVFFLKEE